MKIAVDFDGTIVNSGYPSIGEAKEGAFEGLKELQELGIKLILYTCREDHPTKIYKRYLTDAIDFCKANGVEFDAINENIPEDFDFVTRKPVADFYVDDRGILGIPSWPEIVAIIKAAYYARNSG